MKLYYNIRTLYTPTGTTMRKGRDAMRAIARIDDAAILVSEDGTIAQIGKREQLADHFHGNELCDCEQLLAIPGFVDSHTHIVFQGERSMEFGMRAAGKSYQEVALAGGGIRSTVEKVRNSSASDIAAHSIRFAQNAMHLGTTTIEAKSGYGLTADSEIALLEAAMMLEELLPLDIPRTFLGAHAVPKGVDQSEYVRQVIEEQLPEVERLQVAEFCDVFCDAGYFTNAETEAISKAALARGFKIKLHADELEDVGAAALSVQLGAFSADHLLKVNEDGIRALAGSKQTVATLLPITALSIRSPFAPARALIDQGAAVAIATDCNPGSSMSENMQLAVSLGVIGMQMSVEEALTAATLNGAAALDRAHSHGSLEVGKLADFVLYDIPRLEYLPYHIGVSDLVRVIKRGEIAYDTKPFHE